MIEEIKNTDFNNLDENSSKELLDKILEMESNYIKESINTIIDKIEYDDTSMDDIDNMSIFHKMFFKNEKIEKLMNELLEEYENNTEND